MAHQAAREMDICDPDIQRPTSRVLAANANHANSCFQVFRTVRLAHEGDRGRVLKELPELLPPLTTRNHDGQRRINGTHFLHKRVSFPVRKAHVYNHRINPTRNESQLV